MSAERKATAACDEPPLTGSTLAGAPLEFTTAASRLIKRVALVARDDIRARYAIGQLVHGLRYECSDNETAHALGRLSAALNLKPSTLRRYARVTETISREELAEYVDQDGMPLTWSHLEELAEARSMSVRRRCAELAASEKLSVSALRKRIRLSTRG
jgi:hypothetical protein